MGPFSRLQQQRESRRVRPGLEALEDRLVPSTVAGSHPDGVWTYDTSAGWSHISNLQASTLALADAGDVYGQFDDGVWRYTASTRSWAHLSNLTAVSLQTTPGGILYGNFGNVGVWRWNSATGWMKLSDLNPTFTAVSASDALFGSFEETGAVGTWRWTPAAGWSLLTFSLPGLLRTDNAGEMIGTYGDTGQQGTWRWNPTTGWARLSTSEPQHIAVSGNGAIFENRGTSGIWRAAPGATSFTQIDTTDGTNLLINALPDGGVFENRFSNHTGWYWNGGIGLVKIVNDTSTTSLSAIGKDGDLFFPDSTDGGFGYWSLQVAFVNIPTLMGTKDPAFLYGQR
jgi:hypothetical protein